MNRRIVSCALRNSERRAGKRLRMSSANRIYLARKSGPGSFLISAMYRIAATVLAGKGQISPFFDLTGRIHAQ